MAKKTPKDIRDKAVEAALALAGTKGWEKVSPGDIARKAKISLSELSRHFDDKGDIIACFARVVDRRVLDNISKADPETPVKERLFDILMERFDILNEYRDGLVSILDSYARDPKQAIIGLPNVCRSMLWMLEGADVETNGIKGAAHIAGLSVVYLKALKAWKDDESPDMDKTMAVLDKALSRAEQLASMMGF